MKKRSFNGFTIPELLVVITILTILGSIAFYSYSGYSGTARDTSRISQLGNIDTSLNLYFQDKTKFPDPSNGLNIVYSGATVWTQGELGDTTIRAIGRIYGDLKDPKFSIPYTYSIDSIKKEYQIATVVESNANIVFSPLIESAYAATPGVLIKGNYNGLFAYAKSGNNSYILMTPSILATDISNPSFTTIISGKKLVCPNSPGTPANYKSTSLYNQTGLNLTITQPVLYTGSTQNLGKYSNIKLIDTALRSTYSGSIISGSLKQYLSSTGSTYVKNILADIVGINPIEPYYCKDILDAGNSTGSGYYIVDDDGAGGKDAYEVYCDMSTGGFAWTRLGNNYISRGDFSDGFHSENWTEDDYNREATVVQKTSPIDSGYALNLHSVSGYNTNNNYGDIRYLLQFPDNSVLKQDYEIRLSAWVANAWDQGSSTNGGLGYIFDNKLDYTDGTSVTNGVLETLATQVVSGTTWKLQRRRIAITKTPSNFTWSLGKGTETGTSKDFFVTDVKMELYYK